MSGTRDASSKFLHLNFAGNYWHKISLAEIRAELVAQIHLETGSFENTTFKNVGLKFLICSRSDALLLSSFMLEKP